MTQAPSKLHPSMHYSFCSRGTQLQQPCILMQAVHGCKQDAPTNIWLCHKNVCSLLSSHE